MKIEMKLCITTDDGDTVADEEILTLEKDHDRLEALGLSLAEAKNLLGCLQERIVEAQAAAFVYERRYCPCCNRRFQSKGRYPMRFRTPFGDVLLSSPRLHRCDCQATGTQTFSPLNDLFTSHVAPEMLYLETKWASLVSYGMTVDLLKDVLPIGAHLNAETVRNHLHHTAGRSEAELGQEQFAFVEGCPAMWRDLPHPEGPIVVGIDGGYVRWRDNEGSHFEVTVGKSIAEDRGDRYFGLVQSFDPKPKRRLHEVLRDQGLQMNQEITFLTDGGDTVRNLAANMSPCAEHILDWFHITMRLTVLGQYAKGLKHHDATPAEEIKTHLARIKGYLWNGNVREALFWIELLVDDLDIIDSDYPSLKAFRRAADDFQTYMTNNAATIPNYAERHRYGERVSTGFVESTVNTVVGKRFAKRQQMRWSKRGAHLLLQTRTRALDGTLRGKFESWYRHMAATASQQSTHRIAA